MFYRPTHKPVCNTGKRAGRDELHRGQYSAIRARSRHALIDIALDENALCIFERAKLDRDAHSDTQERS